MSGDYVFFIRKFQKKKKKKKNLYKNVPYRSQEAWKVIKFINEEQCIGINAKMY
jgi:hypothetical protein